MFAKLNHVALISDNYASQTVFYKALFDLKTASSAKAEALAMAMGDGYVGMQIIPRFPGRQAGIDHFGIQVEDIDTVRERVAKHWPAIEIIQRPSTRPFAAYGIHDPAGTYFDLSKKGLSNRTDVYEKPAWEQNRIFSHFAMRAVEPGRLAEFYASVFELELSNDGETYRLTDGRISFVVIPWRISDFLGSGIEKPALDHLGFEVENLDAFRADLEAFSTRNPSMIPKTLGLGPEGKVRRALFERTGLGDHYMSDLDGVLLAVRERRVARMSLSDLLDDLVAANHILYRNGVVDGYGHVSVRHPERDDRFFMAAAISPGRVQRGDLIELDLDGEQPDGGKRHTYSERFIHGEIYRVRPAVQAVVHSHSPAVIPFGLTDVPLRPIIHTASFMHAGVPVFDTKNVPEATTPLINNAAVGRALAAALGDRDAILMRGHGDTVVGPELRITVARAIYTEVNARLLMQTLSLGRPIAYMHDDESRTMQVTLDAARGSSHGTDRVWQMWLDEVRAARGPDR